MDWGNLGVITLLGFGLGTLDAAFGMGYGTILTPVLLLFGYKTLDVVPAVIISQLVADFLSVFFHHQFKNVNMRWNSKDFKVGAVLSGFSLVGSVAAVLFALKISQFALNLYIGILVFAVGVIVIWTRERQADFSWLRLLFLGSIASFNKGMSGGGYGPIVTAGQVLTGVNPRAAIGITQMAEGVTCVAAVITYWATSTPFNWQLSIALSIGVTFSAPLAAYIVRIIPTKGLKVVIGILTLIMGILTILKTARVF
jgi:hypothetical protein